VKEAVQSVDQFRHRLRNSRGPSRRGTLVRYSVTFQAALDLSSIGRAAEQRDTEPVLYARGR
jgi:hypothetical protein